ncbi:sigma-70 family RNA polymerase sigma factor [Streptomonospora litoralis]|uniref:RNA polymerase sigma factor n=1 Tax=Streptomonospora litoralis TaxID=2498135 RepID=A0A4P6Q5K8_9ACTN|nr:sigma-70 family RNA polymerase sigma factor [Streptomonospora litoralis]QBI54057.1 RNA polymerase sigma factor [Streptomonospora litoralis]
MSHEPQAGPDVSLVAAARRGDPQAVEGLLAQSLPLVYNIVGRALAGHSDVDDVVQESLLCIVRGLEQLERPESYRSWMVAVTVRQVRDWIRVQQRTRQRLQPLPEAEQLPDDSDFASLTILRLNLSDQRREVAEATRWLEADDRELLSLWWLEETGRLERAELAAALGLSERHAAMRVRRLKDRIEVGRGIVRALAARPPCPDLERDTRGWDGVPGPLWRKRLARHVRDCAACGRSGGRAGRLAPVEGLLRGLPLITPPPALHQALAEAARAATPHAAAGAAGGEAPAGPQDPPPTPADGVPSGSGPAGSAHGAALPSRRRALSSGHRRSRPPAARRNALAATGAGAVAMGVLAAVAVAGGGPSAPQANAPAPGPLAAQASPAEDDRPAPSPSASPSPAPAASSAAPSPSAAAPPSATAAVPEPEAAPDAASSGRGVGVWEFDGDDAALRRSGADWYYTWATGHPGVAAPAGTEFVPMIWGAESVTPRALAEAEAAGPYLLGFNEPDMTGQADMGVEKALSLWPRLEETGSTLGSPAVAYGADTEGGWLERFMDGVEQRGYRVDFIAVHWYGADFRTGPAVDQLRQYLTAVHRKYGKPIWLTEYALIDFSQGTRYPAPSEQAAFVTASAEMLAELPFVRRHAWFGLGTGESGPTTALFRGSSPTQMGRAFLAAG